MKLSTLALYACTAQAAPLMQPQQAKGDCKVGFVFARGSTEPSPIGMLVGPGLQSALRAKVPGLKTFPVLYAASISTNVSPARTDGASIAKGQAAFKQAANCQQILAGGYSQGAAVMHNVVGKLDSSIKNKVVGVALFGSTRNKQDNGHIPGIPQERSKTWCNKTDGVCGGGLVVNAGHLSYDNAQFREAATWLAGRVKAGMSVDDSSDDSSSADTAAKGAKGARGAKGAKGAKSSGGGDEGHSHARRRR